MRITQIIVQFVIRLLQNHKSKLFSFCMVHKNKIINSIGFIFLICLLVYMLSVGI